MNAITGNPAQLRRAASSLDTQAGALERHGGCVQDARSIATTEWRGSGSIQFACAATTHGKDADRSAKSLRDVARAVRTYAGELETHQSRDRTLRRDIADLELEVRSKERGARPFAGLDPTASALAADVANARSQLGASRRQHERLLSDHHRSLTRLRAALEQAQPPEALWRKGARLAGLGLSYWTLWSQSSAAKVLWQTRKGALTPAQAAAHAGALATVQRGGTTGLLQKERVQTFLASPNGRRLKWLGRAGVNTAMLDAAVPGAVDVWTAGGYKGWRGAVTRYLGMAEVGGVIVSKFPGGKVPGSIAIAAWAAWKAGNKTYDNKDSWKAEGKRQLNDAMLPENFGLTAVVMKKVIAPGIEGAAHPVTGRATFVGMEQLSRPQLQGKQIHRPGFAPFEPVSQWEPPRSPMSPIPTPRLWQPPQSPMRPVPNEPCWNGPAPTPMQPPPMDSGR